MGCSPSSPSAANSIISLQPSNGPTLAEKGEVNFPKTTQNNDDGVKAPKQKVFEDAFCNVHSNKQAHMYCKECGKLACEKCLEEFHSDHLLLTNEQAKRVLLSDCKDLLNRTNSSITQLETKSKAEEMIKSNGVAWTAKLVKNLDRMVAELRETRRNLQTIAKATVESQVADSHDIRKKDNLESLMTSAVGLRAQLSDCIEVGSLNTLLATRDRIEKEVDFVNNASKRIEEVNFQELEDELAREAVMLNVEKTRRIIRNLLMRSRKKFPETNNYSNSANRSILVCIGGRDSAENALDCVEAYIPARNDWTSIPALILNRTDAAAAEANGKLYVAGGRENNEVFDSVEVLEASSIGWELTTAMNQMRFGLSLAGLDRYLYAIGGHDGDLTLNTVEKFDTIDEVWSEAKALTVARYFAACVSINKQILMIGGAKDQESLKSCEVYDPVINNWKVVEPLNQARFQAAAATCGERVFVFGGANDFKPDAQPLDTVEEYKQSNGGWTLLNVQLSVGRRNFGAASIGQKNLHCWR